MAGKKTSFNKVLLIDDSDIDVLVNRRLIELTSFAFETMVTRSGEEALHYLREECNTIESIPDLIFLDIYLPMMTGYEFMEQFALLPESITTKSKVIVLSGFQKPELMEKLKANPFVHHQLDKPLTQLALRALSALLPANVFSEKNL